MYKLSILLSELTEQELTPETMFLLDMLDDMVELGYVDVDYMEEYLNELFTEFEIEVEEVIADVVEVDEDIDEAVAHKSKVVRKGKKKIIFQCPSGFKKVKAGGKKCIKVKMSDKIKRSRKMKKIWRTKIRRKLTRIKVRRKRSVRKRKTWHN